MIASLTDLFFISCFQLIRDKASLNLFLFFSLKILTFFLSFFFFFGPSIRKFSKWSVISIYKLPENNLFLKVFE